jgi:NOL1/NOP2/sun family putative RNA methylase
MSFERYQSIIPDFPRFTETVNTVEPVTFRARGSATAADALQERLRSRGFAVEPLPGLGGYFAVRSGPGSVGQTLEHWLGHLHVQQAVMALPSLALAPEPGERVLDLCAAPGGKTTHLSELMGEGGALVAVDPQEKRIRGLLSNIYRLGCSNTIVVAADGRRLPTGTLFDRVLVDAPCTGEGNCRRGGGPRNSSGGKFRRYVIGAQEALLRRAVQLTRPGGLIVYSTCTFAPEENEAVIDRVLRDAPVVCEPIPLDLPHASGILDWAGCRYHSGVENAWRVYPHHLDSGGLFMARLRRTADAANGSADEERSGVGWSRVPHAFPGEDPAAAEKALSLASSELEFVFGIGSERLRSVQWLVRADHIWAHRVESWPWPGWGDPVDPRSRVVSIGLRAIRITSGGVVVPTNDFFVRWGAEIRSDRTIVLEPDGLASLLRGERMRADGRRPGSYVLAVAGRAVGRGVVAPDGGLRAEVQRAHAERLLALLEPA